MSIISLIGYTTFVIRIPDVSQKTWWCFSGMKNLFARLGNIVINTIDALRIGLKSVKTIFIINVNNYM